VNDIKNLKKIIGTLEGQANQITKFSGLLSAVNDVRVEIESSKEILKDTSNNHKQFLTDSNNRFDDISKRLAAIEKTLVDHEQEQARTSQNLSALDFVTPSQFQLGKKESDTVIIERFNELDRKNRQFLTDINDKFNELDRKTVESGKLYQSSLKKLRVALFLGVVIIVGTVALLTVGLDLFGWHPS
jgi:hypothetical protein